MTELEVIKMLAAYSKELAETDGLGEKGLVQINWAKRLIQALHKPVVMQGLPTETEISAMACLTVNLEDSDTAKIIHKAAFESGARWVISELSSSPAVASEGKGTVAEGMGISATFIDGDFNDSYEARIRRSKGRARLRPKGNRD